MRLRGRRDRRAGPARGASTWLSDFDASVDAVVGRLRGRPALDRPVYLLSEAANHSLLWHGINLADAAVGGPLRRQHALRRSVILVVEQTLVNVVIKSLFRRDRPVSTTAHQYQLRTPLTTSFPSGHASAGACAATLLSEDLGTSAVWWTAAAAVSISRVYVGVHHASDILGGLVLGTVLARCAKRLWPPMEPQQIDDAARPSTAEVPDPTGSSGIIVHHGH